MAVTSKESKTNIKDLKAAGVPDSLITNYGAKLNPNEADRIFQAWTAQTQAEKKKALEARTPDFLKNDPAFQNLPADLQEIAIYNYEVQKANDQQRAQALTTALEQATAQADPYWSSIIRIAQDAVQRGVDEANGDFVSENERLKRLVQNINQDLITKKDFLTLDQQAQMVALSSDLADRQQTYERNMQYFGAEKAAQLASLELDYNKGVDDIARNIELTGAEKGKALQDLARQFNVNMGALVENASQAGLTFSTKRKIAATRLKEESRGMVESTQRQYDKQLADLEANQAYLQSQYQQNTGNIGLQYGQRTAEEQQAYETAQRKIAEDRDALQREYTQRIAELETDAARGNTEAQAQMVDLQRKLQASIQSAGRTAEQYLGTQNLPNIQGYAPLGNVTGQLYEDKVKDIEQRKQALYGELTQASFQY